LIATVRDHGINVGFIRSLAKTHVDNVVGGGPILQVQTKENDWNQRVELYLAREAERSDYRGILSLGQQARLCEKATIADGDVGAIMILGGQLQWIEADRIYDPPADRQAGNRVYVHGVEKDSTDRPLAYHVWDRGRSQFSNSYAGRYEREFFIHCFDPERFAQDRGLSAFVAALNDSQDLREFLEAVKGCAKIENILGLVFKTDLAKSGTTNPLGLPTSFDDTDALGATERRKEIAIGQGAWTLDLLPGEDVTTVQRTTPGPQFEPFVFMFLRFIALAVDMPLEIALHYYSRGSFANIKGAIGQYHASILVRRSRLEQQFLNRWANWRIDDGIRLWVAGDLVNGLKPPRGVKIDPHDYVWQWPMLPLFEPEKEIDNDAKAYKLGAASLSSINAKRNQDWEQITRQKLRERIRIREIGTEEGATTADVEAVMPQLLLPGEPIAGQQDAGQDAAPGSVDGPEDSAIREEDGKEEDDK